MYLMVLEKVNVSAAIEIVDKELVEKGPRSLALASSTVAMYEI